MNATYYIIRNYWRVMFLVLWCFFASSTNASLGDIPFTTITVFDSAGRLTGELSPDPDGESGPLWRPAKIYSYNERGLLESVEVLSLEFAIDETESPKDWKTLSNFVFLSKVEFVYDNIGRKLVEYSYGKNGLTIESLVQYSYDAYDRVECKAVRMNPDVYSSLPANACEVGSPGAFGEDRISRYTYDGFDNVIKAERALGTELEQVHKVAQYSGMQLQFLIDANGNKTRYEYDENSRLKKRIYPSKTRTGEASDADYPDYEEYAYDANGNVTSERKRSGTVFTYTHDNLNRVLTKNGPGTSMDVSYTYDLNGLVLTTLFTSNGQGVSNVFDGFGRLESSTSNMLGKTRDLHYSYDANGNRKTVTHTDNQVFTYNFDQLNRITEIYEGDDNFLLDVGYQNNGRRANILRSNGTVTDYEFDNAQRLASLQQAFASVNNDLTNSFLYNPASQVVSLTKSNSLYSYVGDDNLKGAYVSNGLNQYTAINGKNIEYDANGNLEDDGETSYDYDDENRLLELVGTSNTASFDYDPLGRLFQASVNGQVSQFQWDGDAMVAEFNGSGALVRRFVHGDQVDEPLVQYNGSSVSSSTRRFLHANHQGSIVAHSDDSGEVVSVLSYDAYGIPGESNVERFGYTGQIWFSDLNLYHYKARMYSPTLGRFLQTDPIGYEDQMNLYAYVANDPVNNIDPSGMVIDTIVDVGFVIYDVGALVYDEIANGGANRTENLLALGADSASIFVPFATGGGLAVRAGMHADEVVKVTNKVPDKLYHYTSSKHADSIAENGLRPGASGKVFTTTDGTKSGLQAQIDLALPPNRGVPDALMEIDTKTLQKMGIDIPSPTQVKRDFNMPGGGQESVFETLIPPEAIRRVQ